MSSNVTCLQNSTILPEFQTLSNEMIIRFKSDGDNSELASGEQGRWEAKFIVGLSPTKTNSLKPTTIAPDKGIYCSATRKCMI